MNSRIPIAAIACLLVASVDVAASRSVADGRHAWAAAVALGSPHHPSRWTLDPARRSPRTSGGIAFTARVNGVPWQATEALAGLVPDVGVEFLTLYGLHAPDTGDTTSILIDLTVAPPLRPGTYPLGGDRGFGWYSVYSETGPNIWVTDSEHPGSVLITSIDYGNQTIAGTFYFDAYSFLSETTVAVTEGQFLIPLFVVQVVPQTWTAVKELYRRP